MHSFTLGKIGLGKRVYCQKLLIYNLDIFLRVPLMDKHTFLLGFDGTLTTGSASIVHYYMLQYMLEYELERLTCVTTFIKHKCCIVYSKKLNVPHKPLKVCYIFKY